MPFEREVDALPGFFQASSVRSTERQHVTEKPEAVMREIVRIAPPGALICDPFAGSGTTGIAAVLEGRAFVGVELSEAYFEIGRARFEALDTNVHRGSVGGSQGALFSEGTDA